MRNLQTLFATRVTHCSGVIFLGIFLFGAHALCAPTEERLQQLRMSSLNYLDSSQPRPKLVKNQAPPAPLTYKIVIDAGHGGKDLGAQGLFGISEKVLCLKISKFVKREVEKYFKIIDSDRPVEVELTRTDDTFIPLKERVQIANHWGADLFVSIHANSSPVKKARGFEVYFLNAEATDEEATKLARMENAEREVPIKSDIFSILSDVQANHHIAESSQFAESMFSSISVKALSNGRGVRQGPFTVLHGTTMPAVLVEVGYVTNIFEAKNLTRDLYLKRLANAISTGIVDFVTKKKKII